MKKTQDFYHTSISNSNKIVTYTAVSDFNTLGVDLEKHDGAWVIQISRSASDGSPTATIEYSQNNSNWDIYKGVEFINIDITTGNIFLDDEFIPRYIRIAYKANGATGTVTFKLTLND